MRVGIISDIHANAAALRAALVDAKKAGIEHLLVLGDLVGYYYEPADVLAQLREWPHSIIGGNHEAMLGEARDDLVAAGRHRQRYGSGLDVALDTLPGKDTDWLVGLPTRERVELGKVGFELCHGSPFDRDCYVYPNAQEALLRNCEIANSVVLMGHTHYAMIAQRGDAILLNPGSVGQARDFGGFASWASFDTETRVVTFRRSEYDIAPLVEEARRRDPALPYLHQVLARGRLGGAT